MAHWRPDVSFYLSRSEGQIQLDLFMVKVMNFPFCPQDGVVFTCGCIKEACSSLYRKCNKDGYAEI